MTVPPTRNHQGPLSQQDGDSFPDLLMGPKVLVDKEGNRTKSLASESINLLGTEPLNLQSLLLQSQRHKFFKQFSRNNKKRSHSYFHIFFLLQTQQYIILNDLGYILYPRGWHPIQSIISKLVLQPYLQKIVPLLCKSGGTSGMVCYRNSVFSCHMSPAIPLFFKVILGLQLCQVGYHVWGLDIL